jgi:valyl-tRNA synthetase
MDGGSPATGAQARPFPDRWILSRLNETIRRVSAALEQFRFDQASTHLYQFIWREYCDWYLELIKPSLQSGGPDAAATRRTLLESADAMLRLLHPFMPFLTEEIWQTLPLPDRPAASIMVAPYPEPARGWEDKEAEADFALLERVVTAARNGRALLSYAPGKSVALFAGAREPEDARRIERLRAFIDHLGKGTTTVAPPDAWPGPRVLRLAIEGLTVGVAVEGDVDLGAALARLGKQHVETAAEVKRLESKLANAEFVRNAPAEVVADHRERVRLLGHEQNMRASSESQLKGMLG